MRQIEGAEEYWDTLLAMWDNKALYEYLKRLSPQANIYSEDWINWVGRLR